MSRQHTVGYGDLRPRQARIESCCSGDRDFGTEVLTGILIAIAGSCRADPGPEGAWSRQLKTYGIAEGSGPNGSSPTLGHDRNSRRRV